MPGHESNRIRKIEMRLTMAEDEIDDLKKELVVEMQPSTGTPLPATAEPEAQCMADPQPHSVLSYIDAARARASDNESTIVHAKNALGLRSEDRLVGAVTEMAARVERQAKRIAELESQLGVTESTDSQKEHFRVGIRKALATRYMNDWLRGDLTDLLNTEPKGTP